MQRQLQRQLQRQCMPVPSCAEAAGIRFWVLTGDKTETAALGLHCVQHGLQQPSMA